MKSMLMTAPALPLLRFGVLLIGLASLTVLQAQPYGCHYHDHELVPDEPDILRISQQQTWAARSDSADIFHYDIWLEVPNSGTIIKARTTLLWGPKIEDLDTLTLDLAQLTVDSVIVDGQTADFLHEDPFLKVILPSTLAPGDTGSVTVYYQGQPLRDPVWGGFYFESGYAYNLGIGITSNPPNFGRAWYPCFDNFVERATYDIRVFTRGNRRGYAIGDFVEEILIGADSIVRHYRMNQLLPTYLTNVAVADYMAHRDTHMGHFGPVPIELLGRPAEFNNMIKAFSRLGEAIDAIESWYGPYPWSRVGYVMTTAGAMEHPTNTAFPVNSINNGNGDARLMAHELGHHWWGNITTLRAPTDMWIKEGNAEYCSHLMDEWSSGRDVFLQTVKSNHQEVLARVHQQDGDFLPLSGIPFENIYGRHTYLKGASMLHNMRGYLGDSLFRAGQQSILENHAYQAIDAATYRDHLTQVTGVDMAPYFDAWIYAPGFSSFVIHDWKTAPFDTLYKVSLTLRQGLRAAPELHRDVPIEVSFYSSTREIFRSVVLASDLYSQHVIDVPFEPVHVSLNERGQLNLARLDHQRLIGAPGNYINPFVRFRVNAQVVTDTALVRIDHHWIAPDSLEGQPDLRISGTNFWVVSGLFPDGFQAQGRLSYDASTQNAFLDQDIAGMNEDSLVLLYRPSPQFPWAEHPDYNVIKFASTDGMGDVVINGLAPGEYAMARGQYLTVSRQPVLLEDQVKVYPNPTDGPCFVQWPDSGPALQQVRVFGPLGMEIHRKQWNKVSGVQSLDLPILPAGVYHLVFESEDPGVRIHRTLIRP